MPSTDAQRSAGNNVQQQIVQLASGSHVAELSGTLGRAADECFGGLPETSKLHRRLQSVFGNVKQRFCSGDSFQTDLVKETYKCTKGVLGNSSCSASAEAAASHIVQTLPYVLVYIAMGCSEGHSEVLTSEQKQKAKDMFAGCKSFRAFVTKMLEKSTNSNITDDGGNNMTRASAVEHQCMSMSWPPYWEAMLPCTVLIMMQSLLSARSLL